MAKPTAKQNSARTSCFSKTSSLELFGEGLDFAVKVNEGVMEASEIRIGGVGRELEKSVPVRMRRMEVKDGR